jgi:uncharacterized membrane protein YfcA
MVSTFYLTVILLGSLASEARAFVSQITAVRPLLQQPPPTVTFALPLDDSLLATIPHHLPSSTLSSFSLSSWEEIITSKYAFMFPAMTVVAILCQSAGIGSAAILSPIFLLVFPLLGPEYPLPSAANAIASALLTECFGFISGLSGYWRRGLVDWNVVGIFLLLSLPACLLGALIEPSLATETTLLRGVYATLMLSLSFYLFTTDAPEDLPEDCPVPEPDDPTYCSLTGADGFVYTYLRPRQDWKTRGTTLFGAGLTGLLGVGIGEVVLPQLVRLACVPLPVAAGTSVAIVVMTALTAAVVQFAALASELTNTSQDVSLVQALGQVIPWNLVQYTVPGAVLGGQIAPWITYNQLVDKDSVETAVAVLFGVIGVAFTIKCIMG